MDSELRFKQHIARAATKGLIAAMAVKRLRNLSPSTARRLFEATVAPAVDYASSVWMHRCTGLATSALNRVQKVGAQAVRGCFKTVATTIAESEASLKTVKERHTAKATKFWFNLRSLQPTHPLAKIRHKQTKRFRSPLQRIAVAHKIPPNGIETIVPHPVPPWRKRISTQVEEDVGKALEKHTGAKASVLQ